TVSLLWGVASGPSGLDLATRSADRGEGALGGRDALERHGLRKRSGEHDLGTLGEHRHDAGLLEGGEVDHVALALRQLVQAHLGPRRLHLRAEADLGQAPLQRHLAALEPELVVSALARALALHATAAGLALSGGSAAPDAQPRTLGARG